MAGIDGIDNTSRIPEVHAAAATVGAGRSAFAGRCGAAHGGQAGRLLPRTTSWGSSGRPLSLELGLTIAMGACFRGLVRWHMG